MNNETGNQGEGQICVVTSDGIHRYQSRANGDFCDFCGDRKAVKAEAGPSTPQSGLSKPSELTLAEVWDIYNEYHVDDPKNDSVSDFEVQVSRDVDRLCAALKQLLKAQPEGEKQ